jgi:hypothetical protein
MPRVSDNQLKGNFGAAVVNTRLSAAGCLVRPVAADTDVGVDLYCETVAEGRPFLHFWIQVKTGRQCSVHPASGTASCRFKRDHLEYWQRQPVPVFVAMVPTVSPSFLAPDTYIVDVTTQFIMGHLRRGRTLRSDYHWPASSDVAVSEFLTQVVPTSTAMLQCSRGVVTAAPTPTPRYEHCIPLVPVTQFMNHILCQLRTTATFSILFASSSEEHACEDHEFRRKLARIVGQFRDDEHWENFMALAWSSHADQKYGSALKSYRRAIEIIQKDPKVCNEPIWRERIQHIECLKKRARDRQSPDRAMLCRILGQAI